jgi:hypothetical protein
MPVVHHATMDEARPGTPASLIDRVALAVAFRVELFKLFSVSSDRGSSAVRARDSIAQRSRARLTVWERARERWSKSARRERCVQGAHAQLARRGLPS